MKSLLLADSVQDIFGKITPPIPVADDPTIAVAKFLSVGIQLILIVAALLLLYYLLWGGLDWLTSGGEKEKLIKAQNKLVNAIVGMILVVVALAVFILINKVILGNLIIDTRNGIRIVWPTVAP